MVRLGSLLRRRVLLNGTHEPYLGTVVSVRIGARTKRRAESCEAVLLASLERYEAQFSLFRHDSELSAWRRGEVGRPSPTLVRLLTLGEHWRSASGGVLNPAVGVVAERWKQAEAKQLVPSDDELTSLSASIAGPRYEIDHQGQVRPAGDCSSLTFHALAKGFIVDLAAQEAFAAGATSILLNVGGDLLHLGEGELNVGVEDPQRAFDNAGPLCVVRLARRGMATSGGSRRGYRIGDAWFSHVLDPRTGYPVDHIASASALASDAATSDAIATVLSVVPPDEGLAFVAGLPSADGDVAACVVAADGTRAVNDHWRAIERPPSP